MFEKNETMLALAEAGKVDSIAKTKTSFMNKSPTNNDFIVRFVRFPEKCESESCDCSKILLFS